MVFKETHAPTWGATENGSSISLYLKCFNPRIHVGCDPFYRQIPCGLFRFNPRTHMGCDICVGLQVAGHGRFNPLTHMGCDLCSCKILHGRLLFQSTHPHGVRRTPPYGFPWRVRFNPRTHMGCDYLQYKQTASASAFQSTHPHGVRQIYCTK